MIEFQRRRRKFQMIRIKKRRMKITMAKRKIERKIYLIIYSEDLNYASI